MSLPRWIHRWYAWVAGYFWLPCPVCGREFGGHEVGSVSVPDPSRSPSAGLIACNKHSAERVEAIR